VLKQALAAELELFQIQPDKPFVMHTDASDFAIGAVISQERDGQMVPVGFYSRKLTGSQLNWTPREKETYAIVSALRKWAGWIGFQPIIIKTDHKAFENWVTEHVDTPSGPRGRRARWHECLSQFNLSVEYLKGEDNVVADAMSRYAYPASSAKEDVSFHGSAANREAVKELIAKEVAEGRMVGVVCLRQEWDSDDDNLLLLVAGTLERPCYLDHRRVCAIETRSGRLVGRYGDKDNDNSSDSDSDGKPPSLSNGPAGIQQGGDQKMAAVELGEGIASRTRGRRGSAAPDAPNPGGGGRQSLRQHPHTQGGVR